MARQYYCWKVCLTFRCGCVEYTPTAHRCGPEREGCNAWMTFKRTDKQCEEHRAGQWGLHQQPLRSHDRHREGGRDQGHSGGAVIAASPRREEEQAEAAGCKVDGASGRAEEKGEPWGSWEGQYLRRKGGGPRKAGTVDV